MADGYNKVNIDDVVDYRGEYSAVIKRAQITGDHLVGLCPFHPDKQDSFSADLRTGKWTCFAEGTSGNFTTFYAALHALDTKDAFKEILAKYHVDGPNETARAARAGQKQGPAKREDGPELQSYTVKEYSLEKGLPEEFLSDVCGLTTERGRDGISYVKMPYFLEGGAAYTYRKRYAKKAFRWGYGSAGKINLYGDWRYPDIRKAGYVILVEGESDTQTLWHLGLPALGSPGASNFKPEFAKKLCDLGKVYIHVEPDQGGQTFFDKVHKGLRTAGYGGQVFRLSCSTFGTKDPSELFLKRGKEEAARLIMGAVKSAEEVDLEAKAAPAGLEGAPVKLRQADGWVFANEGIYRINKKTELPELVCKTPILLSKRLVNLETAEEKVEVAYRRDKTWKTAVLPRPAVFTAKGITCLMELGCTVTSENARQVVGYLGELEAENMDLIPRTASVSSLGWIGKDRFLPGHGDGIVLDADPSMARWATGYHTAGTFEGWKTAIGGQRDKYKFRFILAASFAAPLLKIVGQRIFMVYNWGGAKTGKTAALKAALSVWGDWEKILATFNATTVAIERMAGFYRDLPMGIDERQLAGKDQQGLEKMVYMIASGSGRLRGTKTGGLQALTSWQTIALATGEEPLATNTSQAGVSARTIELYNGPFEHEEDGMAMHRAASADYGHAGPLFISWVLHTDEGDIRAAHARMVEEVRKLGPDLAMAHVTEIAVVALADALVDMWVFGNDAPPEPADGKIPLQIPETSWNHAVQMAASVAAEQQSSGVDDVNENAKQYIVDWILSNKASFGGDAFGQRLGALEDGKAYIFPSLLTQALEKGGFSYRKTIRYLAEAGLVAYTVEASGKTVYSIVKKLGGKPCRVVAFDLDVAAGGAKEEKPKPQEPEWEPAPQGIPFDDGGGDGEQMELPF